MPTTNSAFAAHPRSDGLVAPAVATKKVVVVNGDAETFDNLDILDAGHYDVVFVESNEHAYSQVKRVQPNLVILCTRIDDPEGFRVLSMLKLDDETRSIPVVTYTSEDTRPSDDDDSVEMSDTEMLTVGKPALPMN
jgi:PleD family two-component response regulator